RPVGRPRSSRTGVECSIRARRLLLETADVVHQRPAILVREMLPGRHGPAPVGDLPEDIAVGFALHLGRGPVGGLGRRQRGGGRAVALPFRAVTGRAVRFCELLALGNGLGILGRRILHRLRVRWRLPLGLRRDHGSAGHEQGRRYGNHALRPRPHEPSSGLFVPITPLGPRLIQPAVYSPARGRFVAGSSTRPLSLRITPDRSSNGTPGSATPRYPTERNTSPAGISSISPVGLACGPRSLASRRFFTSRSARTWPWAAPRRPSR